MHIPKSIKLLSSANIGGGGTLVNEVHAAGINGDVGGAERSDGSGRSMETHEMHIDIAVVTEGGRD